ncbi:MAG: hypothetical protein GXO43_05855 [Crenarchaeota archaeon]|nr:hypothetical protein [Thermoproteota archaeon]
MKRVQNSKNSNSNSKDLNNLLDLIVNQLYISLYGNRIPIQNIQNPKTVIDFVISQLFSIRNIVINREEIAKIAERCEKYDRLFNIAKRYFELADDKITCGRFDYDDIIVAPPGTVPPKYVGKCTSIGLHYGFALLKSTERCEKNLCDECKEDDVLCPYFCCQHGGGEFYSFVKGYRLLPKKYVIIEYNNIIREFKYELKTKIEEVHEQKLKEEFKKLYEELKDLEEKEEKTKTVEIENKKENKNQDNRKIIAKVGITIEVDEETKDRLLELPVLDKLDKDTAINIAMQAIMQAILKNKVIRTDLDDIVVKLSS